jgi:hypothetical protein
MIRRGFLKSRRGLSHHIEMIFAFVLFITFVFFVLIFVSPADNNYLSDSVVSGVNYNFFESSKVNLFRFFINVSNSNGLGDCFKFEIPSGLISDDFNSSFVGVVNSGFVGSSVDDNFLYVSDINNNSYYVLLSDEFMNGDLSGCSVVGSYNYSFGSFREDEVLSFSKLRDLKSKYDSDYEELKVQLAIPSVFDFAIISDIIKMERDVFSYEVLAREYVYPVLLEDGSIKIERFSIRLWR